ncbi:MAG: penicillin-binding transpeptidase domain-containing protein [Patescibacteria group bacterium UBA2163]
MSRIRRKKRYETIDPDEILIDAQNLPGFDANRLEGRIERPIERRAYRIFLILALLIGLVFLGQLLKLQVLDAATLKERAEANRLNQTLIIAERGRIVDRYGDSLALNNSQPESGFSKRFYPLGEAAAHIVGYVSYPKRDSNGFWFQETVNGLSGLESRWQDRLGGDNGFELKETSATGEVISGSIIQVPRDGEEIVVAIDAELQKELFNAIKERADNSSFNGGSGVIMNVHTGEIHALASYPSFDPNVLADGSDSETVSQYVSDTRAPFLDRAIAGVYAPGSVVKPFVALAALEEEIIAPEKEILSTGSISIPNPYNPELPTIFRDWKAHGWVDMREALAVSSDVYFYAIGGGYEDQRGLGISTIQHYMNLFGFGAVAGINLDGEARGVVPDPDWKAEQFDGERWFLGNTYHTSIGQYGFQVTALQLARATAALANGGILLKPTLEKNTPTYGQQLNIAPENLHIINEGMRQAVTDGTAAALALPDVAVAGKTGTAEVGQGKAFINSLIIGFFPYEKPQFAFAIIMERADAGTTSGAPLVMRNVLEWIITERPQMIQD